MHPMSAVAMAPCSTMRIGRSAVVVMIVAIIVGCSGGDGADDVETSETSPPTVSVPDDHSLQVAAVDNAIELSFTPADQPRAMWARMLQRGDDGWIDFGVLRTGEANAPGELVIEPRDQVLVLDGVNFAPAADVYAAPDLPVGQYLVCAGLIPPPDDTPITADDIVQVCGEVTVD